MAGFAAAPKRSGVVPTNAVRDFASDESRCAVDDETRIEVDSNTIANRGAFRAELAPVVTMATMAPGILDPLRRARLRIFRFTNLDSPGGRIGASTSRPGPTRRSPPAW